MKKLFKYKFSIIIIIILLSIIIYLFAEKQNYKFLLLYQYQTIPNIELTNTLTSTQVGLSGQINGFVRFNDISKQPKNAKQYYIIKPLYNNLGQYLSVETIIKMPSLSPRSLGISELTLISSEGNSIILKDENGNNFFINKSTRKVSMKDVNGDNITLITDDLEYRDFIIELFKN